MFTSVPVLVSIQRTLETRNLQTGLIPLNCELEKKFNHTIAQMKDEKNTVGVGAAGLGLLPPW